ncbi:MAG: hypothetical protein A2V88_05610 [Elusimicrobia bacterium RBG_16_66_12]|nr:MAG: hypothetical protein A2V88_05610 [Elusimicrobia bacterium RBG_16_66_12]
MLCLVSSLLIPLTYQACSISARTKREKEAIPSDIRTDWTVPSPLYPDILDPQKVLTGTEKGLLLLTYSRLVKVNDALALEADLLESWTYDIDSKIFRFRIKNGLIFHDGKPVSSDDVLFSFHQWAEKDALDSDLLLAVDGVDEFRKGLSPSISGVRKIDELSFEVTLNHWAESFVRNLSIPRFVIFPVNFGGRSKEEYLKSPVGTGPYRLISAQGGIGKYIRFDQYYLGKPLTKEIDIARMAEPEARRAYGEGRVNNLFFYQIADPEKFNKPDDVLDVATGKTTFLLVISASQPLLRERSIRREIATRIDKKKIVERCYPNASIAESIIPPGLMGSPSDSVTEAAILGHPSRLRTSLPLYLEDRVENNCLGGVLPEILKGSGIRVSRTPFNEMYRLLKSGQLAMWVEDFNFKNEDPISTLQYFSQSSNEYLLGHPIAPLQEIFTSLNGELTPLDRARKYAQIDRYLTRNYFVIPLFYPQEVLVHKKMVRGAEFLRTTKFVAGWHSVYVEK